jgi:hypothetical protein
MGAGHLVEHCEHSLQMTLLFFGNSELSSSRALHSIRLRPSSLLRVRVRV